MVTNEKTYSEKLIDLRDFLADKRKITDLSKKVGVTTRLVYAAFSAKSVEELTGKKIDVIRVAKEMREEIESVLDLSPEKKR